MGKLKKLVKGQFTFGLIVSRISRQLNVHIKPSLLKKLAGKHGPNETLLMMTHLKAINICTYDGCNQVVHPDVIVGNYHGRKVYFMAVTPYPFGDPRYENPCVYYSGDGETWEGLPGVQNPIAYPQRGKHNHLSDAEIFIPRGDDGELWVYYRESTFEESGNYDNIYRKKINLEDNCSNTELLCKFPADGIISPSMIKDGDLYQTFFVRRAKNEHTELVRVITKDGTLNGKIEKVTIKNEPLEKKVWHIDVVRSERRRQRLHAMITYANGIGGAEARLYYAMSCDNGETFEIMREVDFNSENAKPFNSVYRSCLVRNKSGGDIFHLYISAQNMKSNWYVYLYKDFLNDKD